MEWMDGWLVDQCPNDCSLACKVDVWLGCLIGKLAVWQLCWLIGCLGG